MVNHHASQPIKPNRVVILGASGFIGSALMEYYHAMGIVTLGLRAIELTRDILDKNDVLILLSAITPDKVKNTNTAFIENIEIVTRLSDILRRQPCAQIIYVSSDSVYGATSGIISENTIPQPESLYGMMHLLRENLLRFETKSPLLILRLTQVYGAGDTHNSYGPCRMLRSAIQNNRIDLFGGGEETRDHLYIEDVVNLISRCVSCRSEGILNIATGCSLSFFGVASVIKSLLKKEVVINSIFKERIINHRQFDNALLKTSFKDFKFTSLQNGLLKMIHHLTPG